MTRSGVSGMSTLTVAITGRAEAPQRCKNRRRSGRPLELNFRFLLIRGPRIIAVASNPEHLWSEQHGIKTRTKRNHSRTNSGRLTIGGNYSRSPLVKRISDLLQRGMIWALVITLKAARQHTAQVTLIEGVIETRRFGQHEQ